MGLKKTYLSFPGLFSNCLFSTKINVKFSFWSYLHAHIGHRIKLLLLGKGYSIFTWTENCTKYINLLSLIKKLQKWVSVIRIMTSQFVSKISLISWHLQPIQSSINDIKDIPTVYNNCLWSWYTHFLKHGRPTSLTPFRIYLKMMIS